MNDWHLRPSAEAPIFVLPRPAQPRAPLALQQELAPVLLAEDLPHELEVAVASLVIASKYCMLYLEIPRKILRGHTDLLSPAILASSCHSVRVVPKSLIIFKNVTFSF